MNAVSTSRRNFMRGAAAMPFALWLSKNAWATTPLVRYDASSANGLMMLQIFADAVAKMKLRGESDPLSWLWQWYTHFVDGATTKAAEMNRIFGASVTPQSMLAGETWNTCQSHAGQNANHFLPWHRMFVFFLEQIVREVAQRPDFTLPYWNYTSHDPAKRGVVPLQFRLPNDPLYGSLYRPDRTSLANSGQPIHLNQPGDAMDIAPAMACPYYHTVNAVPGFCRVVDSGIHGRIHVLVGNGTNMGAVPYAGKDPLFWVHHSNVDRLWASWMLNGGTMPVSGTWQNSVFVFADAYGQRVSGTLRDFFSIDTLGYTYDKFVSSTGTEPTSKRRTKALTTLLTAAIGLVSELVARGTASAELNDRPVRIGLAPVSAAARQAVVALDPLKRRRTYLVLKDLHTWAQPEVLYHLYLTRSQDTRLTPKSYVGNINFFDAEFHDHGNGALSDALGDNFYGFDVTELLRSMVNSGAARAGDTLALSFVPGGTPTSGAKPLVGSIEMFWQ